MLYAFQKCKQLFSSTRLISIKFSNVSGLFGGPCILRSSEFLLKLIKEMCCDPPAESAPAPLPVVEMASFSKSIEKGSNVSCTYAEASPACLATYAT